MKENREDIEQKLMGYARVLPDTQLHALYIVAKSMSTNDHRHVIERSGSRFRFYFKFEEFMLSSFASSSVLLTFKESVDSYKDTLEFVVFPEESKFGIKIMKEWFRQNLGEEIVDKITFIRSRPSIVEQSSLMSLSSFSTMRLSAAAIGASEGFKSLLG